MSNGGHGKRKEHQKPVIGSKFHKLQIVFAPGGILAQIVEVKTDETGHELFVLQAGERKWELPSRSIQPAKGRSSYFVPTAYDDLDVLLPGRGEDPDLFNVGGEVFC